MSDSQTNESDVQQTTWKDIVLDLLILIVIMGAIGFVLKFAMDACAVKSPIENLVAAIRKGDVDDKANKDEGFLTELAEGRDAHADFINKTDDTGRTPLMSASYANSIDPKEVAKIDMRRLYYVRVLLAEKGIKPDAADRDGFTALHWACWSGLDGVALELINHGLDINQAEDNGYTPLMLAAMRGNASTVKMLLQLGADASPKNYKGETALELAESHQKAYAANESQLYVWVTHAYVSVAFWMDDKKREEARKHTKGALFYFPIYKEGRSDSHSESVNLLKNPPARVSREELLKELAVREEKARKERMKEKDKGKAEEKAETPAETPAEAPAEAA